ncbi:MAG: substrate-binding domain-containing protein [Clostridiales bacterium]|nr:substrate-binding domain-containing protein [Clostridiales bacterium]
MKIISESTKLKCIFAALLTAVYLICLSACIRPPEPTPGPGPSPYPDPDILNDNINQRIEKPVDWALIVEHREVFQLGVPCSTNSFGTFPAIDGSTVLLPLAAEFGWQFLDLADEQVQLFFRFSTTHDAYLKLIGAARDYNASSLLCKVSGHGYHHLYKQPDIILVTPPSIDELNIANSYGVELIVKPICYDSFVFITHIDNPVNSLTVEEVQKIYSGEITNWRQVGGNDEEIVAFQREAGSGSQTAMEEFVMAGIEMMEAPMGWTIGGMGFLINKFAAEYQNAPQSLGYTYKYYIDRLYKSPDIKIIKINGIEPNDNNVRNSTYPFVVPYNGVIRSDDIANVGGKFLDWLLSEEGQRCIAQAGYVSLMSLDL